MEFEEWEIDNDLWHAVAEAGETPPWDPPVEESSRMQSSQLRASKTPLFLCLQMQTTLQQLEPSQHAMGC